ncbi:MAG: hypothetical protein WA885_19385 [Phormidesmis sp.]
MQSAPKLKSYARCLILAAFLTACTSQIPHTAAAQIKLSSAAARNKTEADPGEPVGPATDCDGDGLNNDSQLDFDGDGRADECVGGREEIPEPPFQQTYTPTSEAFYSKLPEVGWNARYNCGDDLYEVTLQRPDAGSLVYIADGLTLTSDIVYDDIDPNLNQPLIIQDPTQGIRYSFEQAQGGEFYEYALADYNGNIGLYIYQTGEQIVAAPCTAISATVSPATTTELSAKAPAAK